MTTLHDVIVLAKAYTWHAYLLCKQLPPCVSWYTWHVVGYGLRQYCNISLSWYIVLNTVPTSYTVEHMY